MWRNIGFTFLFVVLVALCHCSAFQPSSVNPSKTLVEASAKGIRNDDENNRRKFFAQVASATLAIGSASLGQVNPAQASGGATAGGAYLLSAKQRYNDRVIKGIKGFLALESSLKAGSVDEAKAYFAGNEEGQFGDISTAGYLLANAFRTNSNKAPDSLPSVKKWKAFTKELDGVQKSIKKKDSAGALSAYQSAEEALDKYLAEVELPSVMELKK